MTYIKENSFPLDFNKCWSDALKQYDGTYSERIRSDEVERDFWETYMGKKGGYHQDETAKEISTVMKEIIANHDISTILEIGPGWGNYTMDLAELCSQLTCVDISNNVLSYILKIGKENNKNNISTIFGKFEDVVISDKYDFVFGYNCFYRMTDLASVFEKMNNSATKLCMMGMGMALMPDYYKDMEEKLGLKLIYGKKDYIYFINILYQMSIDANLRIIPMKKRLIYNTWEEVMKNETERLENRISDLEQHSHKINNILQTYFKLNNDGKYEYSMDMRGSLVYWVPKTLSD